MNKKSLLEHSGLRATRSRLQILEILENSDTPLSAREVWQQLPQDKTGFATVYRALSALCETGLAKEILSKNNALYEFNREEGGAPQLICSRCGKVEDITDPTVLKYNENINKRRGLDDHHGLLLYADCRRKECDKK